MFFSCYKETTIANHTRGFFRKQAGLDEGPQWCAEPESEELSSSPDRGLLCRVLRQDT